MKFKNKSLNWLLAAAIALPLPTTMIAGSTQAFAEGPTDPAPFIAAKVVNQNAGKKVLFDNTHGQTAGAADWVIDGGFSDFGNALANAGFAVQELRKTTPITYDDLKNYDVFVIGEANIPYKKTEQDAMLQYVQNGGSIFFIADHYNADRNKNRWDASEVMNGYRRGAFTDPAKGMTTEERNSEAMQGLVSSDWLGQNFGIRFRYNALGDINATNLVSPDQSFGITNGVGAVAVHAGSTLAVLDPKKAKGLVYVPQTNDGWGSAVDQGVYNGGGTAEGPFSAISKLGLGKAAFIGDSSPIEDATPKYLREENGSKKVTYDGWKEVDDAKYFVNLVNWLATKESYTSFDQVNGLNLDQPTKLYDWETPEKTTEPQAEPWSAPDPGYKWYDPTTFKAGSYGGPSVVTPPSSTSVPSGTAFSFVHQAQLPNAQNFQFRVVLDNLTPNTTYGGLNVGAYLTGGTQVAQFSTDGGATWSPAGTTYGYSDDFSLTSDALGHATKDVTVRVKSGTNGAASLRLRQAKNNLKTEAVTFANVAAEPLPKDVPPLPATQPISDARTKAKGTIVTVDGVVTSKPGAFGGQAFYIQDATGGVYVYQNQAGFNVGDKVTVTGAIDIYNSEVEVTNIVNIAKTGTTDLPAKVTVSSLSDANQGQLVTLQNVTIQNTKAATPAGSFEFDAVSGTNSTHVRVDGRTGVTLANFPYHDGQFLLSLSGVSAIFKDAYQLKPLSLDDFAVDTQAPVTEAALSSQPNENGWNNQDVTVTLTATDNVGVARTEYSTTEGTWYVYSGPFTVSAEGANTVKFHSVDTSGNTEADKSVSIQLDKTAPGTTASASAEANENGWYNQDVTVSLQATDEASGVATTESKVNDGAWTAYSNPHVVSAEGTTTVQYRSTDKAGNAEDAKSLSLKLDKTAPTATLTEDGKGVHDVAADSSVSFALTAADALSGVATEELYLDDKKIESGAAVSALSLGLGAHTIKATVTDLAGNTTGINYVFQVTTSIATMQNLLNGLAKSGDVKNGGIAQSITAKLNAAQGQLDKGHADQAKQHLAQLKSTLSDLANAGSISANAKTVLTQSIDYLLANGVK